MNGHVRDQLDALYDWRNGAGRRNVLTNSHMDIWQVGTTIAVPSTTKTYLCDMWAVFRPATGCTVSRQTGPTGQAYTQRVQRDSGNASTGVIQIIQAIETLDSYQLAGQTCQLKLVLRSGANFSAASSNVLVKVTWGTGVDQDPTASWTGTTDALSILRAITATATEYTFDAISIPANATQVKVDISFTPVGTAGANDWFELSAAQLTAGETPTIERLPTSQTQIECQRHFVKLGPIPGGATAYAFADGSVQTSSAADFTIRLPVEMRAKPTVTVSAVNDFTILAAGVQHSTTGMTLAGLGNDGDHTTDSIAIRGSLGAAMTAGHGAKLTNNQDKTNGAIFISARL